MDNASIPRKTLIRGRKLDILCYVEGYRIPVKSIYMAAQVGIPTTATINTIPSGGQYDIFPTSHIVIFYAYLDNNDQTNIRSKYKLLFHGEVSGINYSKSGINTEYQILVVDSRSYLNRLPDRAWAVMYQDIYDFYPDFADDASFLGIDVNTAHRYLDKRGLLIEAHKYKLQEYVDKIMGVLQLDYTGYAYYYNANRRFKIEDNHYIIDHGHVFEALWGALYKSSMMQNMIFNMIENSGTTMDSLASSLVGMGYNYLHVLSPKYGHQKTLSNGRAASAKGGKSLYEYVIVRDLINHRCPRFNFILVDRNDNISLTTVPPPITATKYKYKLKGSDYPIENTIYPTTAMKNNKLQFTDDEKLYGINREVRDMDYFYNAFLKDEYDDPGRKYKVNMSTEGDSPETAKESASITKGGLLFRKHKYDFLLARTGRNSITLSKGSFIPEYVMGVPSVVYDPLTDRCYRGTIWKVSYSINLEGGSSTTAIDLVNTQPMDKKEDIDALGQGGCNPLGEQEFRADEKDFYNRVFYQSDKPKDNPMLSSADIADKQLGEHDSYYKFIERDHCTMHQYLGMYGCVDQKDTIPEDLLDAYRNESKPSDIQDIYTLDDNHYGPLDAGSGMRHMFLRERRDRALILYKVLKQKVIYEK